MGWGIEKFYFDITVRLDEHGGEQEVNDRETWLYLQRDLLQILRPIIDLMAASHRYGDIILDYNLSEPDET